MKLKDRARDLRERAASTNADVQAKWDALVSAKQALADVNDGESLTETAEYTAAQDAKKAYEAAADAHAKIDAEYKAVLELMGEEAPENPAKVEKTEAKTIGAMFTGSDVYADVQDRIPNGGKSKVAIGSTPAVKVADRAQASRLLVPRAAVFSTPDNVVAPDQAAGIKPLYNEPTTVLDYITMASTDSTSVKWVREKAFTNAAAEVAETTQATRSSNVKPESSIELEAVSFDVKTVAHWLPASKQSIRDIAGMESLINSKLQYGLRRRLARQVMIGDGEGENFLGIANTTGIGSVEASGATAMHLIEDIYDASETVRKAYGERPNVGFVPAAIYKTLRFARDNSGATEGTGGFLFGPPNTITPVQVEGTLILPNDDITTPIVGVFREFAVWMHEGISLSMTDSHDDFFIRNLIAILAEFSAAAGAMESVAFCEIAPAS